MNRLNGKRLLILGGKSILVDIVNRAKELGVYTIVTDNTPYEKAPAKQAADKSYDISFSEIDKMVKLIEEEQIDGVLTGFTDSYLTYYHEICKAAGLPCYGGSHQFNIAVNKAAFKQACINAGVPVIPGRETKSLKEAKEEANKQGYPVILKPADNSGSRGVIKCEKKTDIEKAYSFARSFSSMGLVIVEKFMDCDNIAISYFMADGDLRLTTTCERKLHISPDTGSSITSFTHYPSKYTDRYIKEVGTAVEKMLIENNFRNGMIAFQAFVDEKSFYFCEMCFRPSGGHHYILIEDQSKIDEMALMIEFAIYGNCRISWKADNESPYFKNNCAMVKLIGAPGKVIKKFEGIEKVQKREDVIKIIPMCKIGDTIGADGTTAQVLAVIWYRCKRGTSPIEMAHRITEEIIVEDEIGNSISRISIM